MTRKLLLKIPPQMRAANQQDLIYKRGQAGVVKASVTIVFDNSDPAKSPDGLQTFSFMILISIYK